MRIHCDLAALVAYNQSPSGKLQNIIEVDKTPSVYLGTTPTINAGLTPPANGRFCVPVLPGNDFPISTSSYILNAGVVDGGDVNSIAFSQLLST